MRTAYYILIAIGVVAHGLCVPVADAQAMGKNDVLNKLSQALDAVSSIDTKFSVRLDVTGAIKDDPAPEISTIIYRRDGDRRDIQVFARATLVNDEQVESGYRSRDIFDGGRWFLSVAPGPYMGQFTYSSQGPEKLPRRIPALAGAETVEGYFARDGACCVDQMRRATDLALTVVSENGMERFLMKYSLSGFGKYAVWVAPDQGWNIVKATVEKSGDDWHFDKKMSEHYHSAWSSGTASGGNFPSDIETKVAYTYDNVEFKTVDGIVVPVACKVSERATYDTGEEVQFEWTITRTKIALKPNWTEVTAFAQAIPEGARIDDLAAGPSKSYVWRSGELGARGSNPTSDKS